MKVDTLAQQCTPEALEKLEQKMAELDEKRNKKKSAEIEHEEEAEDATQLIVMYRVETFNSTTP